MTSNAAPLRIELGDVHDAHGATATHRTPRVRPFMRLSSRKKGPLRIAILSDRPDVRVEWSSLTSMPLDGAEGYGRCAVCNCWVYDAESTGEWRRGGVSRGAVVGDRMRCDEHLPPGHPLCFAGRGYEGPVPE